jgi:hypothetical protein
LSEPPYGITHRQAGARREDNKAWQEAEGTEMTWVGVSGSWRYALPRQREAVHKEVAAALAAGKSIVTGGPLGTDYWTPR